MRRSNLLTIVFCILLCSVMLTAQVEREQQEETDIQSYEKKLIDRSKQPVYINARIWLVYSLARFDISIDNNLIEIRADVELRRDSSRGELIRIADVRVNNQRLVFDKDRFRKRRILPGQLLDSVELKLCIADGPCIKQQITLPTWTQLIEPKPKWYKGASDLEIRWNFTGGGSYANLSVTNFHTGKSLVNEIELSGNRYKVPISLLPSGESLLRVFVIEPWFHVKKMRDPMATEESEISIVSWSQSFIRIKK